MEYAVFSRILYHANPIPILRLDQGTYTMQFDCMHQQTVYGFITLELLGEYCPFCKEKKPIVTIWEQEKTRVRPLNRETLV